MNGRNDEDWAVFWCALLSPLLVGEVPEDQRGRYLRDLSEQERLLPGWWDRSSNQGQFRS